VNPAAIAAPPSPYKGLAPFEDSALDALLFFGRERQIEVIVANLMASRLTVLYGVSGVGKTSLLRAGVAHRLRRAHDALVVVLSSWTGDPVGDLLDAVRAAAPEGVEPPRRGGSFADELAAWTRRLDSDVYVILDQFEEYFLYHENERGAGTLMDELPEALRRGGLRVNFLLGVREDALAQLDAFKVRIPNLFGNSLRLDRLDRIAAQAAIEGPLERYNELVPKDEAVVAEAELVEAVLHQVAVGRVDLGQSGRGGVDELEDGDRIEAPYLQLVLERLWEVETEQGSRRLRLETLEGLGGAAHIVEDHLERAMAELSPEEKDAAAAMYNHLVTPSGTKIAHRAGDLAGYASVDEAETERVLNRLVEERIVRAGKDGAEGPRYEIFHDVLAEAVLAWRTRHEAERRIEAERHAAARRHRRLLALAIGALVLIAILAAIAVYALVQRGDARDQARRARGREIAARAVITAPVDPEQAVRLALQAARLDPSRAADSVLRSTLRGLRVKAVLPGGGPVTDVDFTRDGKLLVAADGDGKARIYRADDGRLIRTLPHGSLLSAAVFSPDGSEVVTAGEDGTARIWRVQTGALLYRLRHGGPVTSAAFSPEGGLLATTSEDGTASLWNVRTGRLLHRLDHPAGVRSASFSGDGSLLVTVLVPAARDHSARVWDVASGTPLEQFDTGDTVTSARFAPTGRFLVTAGIAGIARVWDTRSEVEVHDLVGHSRRILDAEFSPSDRQIVTASTDGTGRVWDTRTGDLLGVLTNHLNYVMRATFSPDGETVATASRDRIARIFDPNGTLRATLVGHRAPVVDVAFSKDGKSVATASEDGTARLWDRRPQPDLLLLGRQGRLRQDGPRVVAVAFDSSGRRVVSAGSDGSVRIWRVGPPRPPLAEFRVAGKVGAVGLNADGKLAAVATADGVVLVRNARSGRTLRVLPHAGPARSLSFSLDGRTLAILGEDRRAHLWDLGSGRQTRAIGSKVTATAFSPDGQLLATGGADAVARIWDATSGKPVSAPLVGHHEKLTSVAFSPDGRYLVTTSYDHDARVWDARTGRSIWTLGHNDVVSGAAFSADGRWVVTAGPGAAGVWDVATGRKLFGLNARDPLLTAVAFSQRGWRIATGGIHGTVKIYDCRLCGNTDDLVSLARQRLAHLRH
jgi:WD40 repeat protein